MWFEKRTTASGNSSDILLGKTAQQQARSHQDHKATPTVELLMQQETSDSDQSTEQNAAGTDEPDQQH